MIRVKEVKINYNESFFCDREIVLAHSGEFSATAFKFSTGVCGLRIKNSKCSMVLLPYHGHQIWFAEFNGKNLTQKTIFNEPLTTKNFGDNYGALLLHCGLSAMGNPGPEDSHPLHGELPAALFTDNYIKFGTDENGDYMAAGGKFNYKNAQEYNYNYMPELRLYKDSTVARMFVDIENLRGNPMQYMCMYHINWLAVEGSRIVGSVPNDNEHIFVDPVDEGDGTERAMKLYNFGKKFIKNPELGNVLNSNTQVFDPEYCVDMRYVGDKNNWAHAMQIMPDDDACYVGWRRDEMPNGLRWYCRTSDEDGLGFALPTTGNHMGYTYNKKHGMFNVIPAHGKASLRFDFGYLNNEEAVIKENYIKEILGD